MPTSSHYIKAFFERGRVVFNDKTRNKKQNKKLFNSVLVELHVNHPQFIENCTKENILKIDEKNLIIELIL